MTKHIKRHFFTCRNIQKKTKMKLGYAYADSLASCKIKLYNFIKVWSKIKAISLIFMPNMTNYRLDKNWRKMKKPMHFCPNFYF